MKIGVFAVTAFVLGISAVGPTIAASPGCQAFRGTYPTTAGSSISGTGFSAGDTITFNNWGTATIGIGLYDMITSTYLVAEMNSSWTYIVPNDTPNFLSLYGGYTAGASFSWSCTPGPIPSIVEPAQTVDRNAQVSQFLDVRSNLLMSNIPGTSRRVQRLQAASSSQSDEPEVLSYLDVSSAKTSASSSISLKAIADAARPRRQEPFDVWMDGTFSLLQNGSGDGKFSTGSAGADYLINPDLLVGGFISFDNLDKFPVLGDTISGLGWMAGPYATARLTDNLFLDVIAGAGTATNSLNTATGISSFGSTRWMVNANLEGSWSTGPWTFAPRLGAGYVEERSDAFATASGQAVGPVTSSVGRITLGPGIIHSDEGEGYRRDLSLRFDTVATLARQQTLGGRVEAGIDFQLDGGAKLGTSANYSWIGEGTTAAGVSFKMSGGF